jgi:DNA-binding protein H-NS
MDYTLISIDELLAEKIAIEGELRARASSELEALEARKQQLQLLVNSAPEPIERRTRKVGSPKYRNPNNPAQTWTGRGKKPNWMNGGDPDQYRIAA